MAILLFLIATTTLYVLLFWFAGRRTREQAARETEASSAPDAGASATTDQYAWTALDDHQLDRLLKESSP